jgi:hypothetical protein
MTLGRENISVAGTDRGADVFGLAGFFRDDDLIDQLASPRLSSSWSDATM